MAFEKTVSQLSGCILFFRGSADKRLGLLSSPTNESLTSSHANGRLWAIASSQISKNGRRSEYKYGTDFNMGTHGLQ